MTLEKKSIRLWPLYIIVSLAVLAIIIVWLMDAGHRQDRVMLTQMILIIAAILGIVWLMVLSRVNWRIRLIAFGVFAFTVVSFAALFRFDGFSGDLAFKFEWRWRKATQRSVGSLDTQDTPTHLLTDFPQFLGPNRDATVTNIKLNTDWENTPPKLVWKQPIGDRWSGFAVVGESAITQEQEGEWEKVVCYDLLTGQEKWTHKDRARYYTPLGRLGPRATPTIDGERVFTIGSTGILNCLDFDTGNQIWTTNIFEENNAEPPPWGVSVSPLVYQNLVIVSAGGAVAYYKETGDIAWKGQRAKSAYSSPVLLTLAGTEQIVLFDHGLVTSHEPTTGELLWEQPWPTAVECVAQPTPLPGGKLLVSTAYGIGTKLFQISKSNQSEKFNVNLIWETIFLKAKFTTIIYYKDHVYGLDDGIFTCLNSVDGTRKWKRGRYGHGQTILISDVLLVLTEDGKVVLLETNPASHQELAQFQVLSGQTWNNPALAGNYLLVRNNREAACYLLPTM